MGFETTGKTETTSYGETTVGDNDEQVCGDGEITGTEQCDDGVNDNTYGSCTTDCSARAAHCGDGIINGPETCDDGINDNAYGGCTPTCERASYCGDGVINGLETCDDGEDNNIDGQGCNTNCILSGSLLGTFTRDGLTFCENANLFPPQYNTEGRAYILVGGQCSTDSILLLDFDSNTMLVAEHQEGLILPSRNFQDFTARGDDWLFSTYSCNFAVDGEGSLIAEVCSENQSDRHQGTEALEALNETTYLAMDDNDIAIYGLNSPANDDSPNPLIVPDTSNGTWFFTDAIFGHNNTVVQVGGYRYDINSPNEARVFQYTMAGNLAQSGYHNDVEFYNAIVASPDGGYIVSISDPSAMIRKLNANLSVAWTQGLPDALAIPRIDVDASNDPLVVFRDSDFVWHLEKRSPDGQRVLWRHDFDEWNQVDAIAMSVAPDNTVWVSLVYLDITQKLDVLHFAP